MEDVNQDAATQNEELVEGTPGSEDVETSGGDSGREEAGGTDLNPKAFKGLQRRLSAKDRELAEAQSRIQELQSQAQSGALTTEEVIRLVKPVIDSIKEDNPELARNLAISIASTIDQRQNQSAQQELNAIKAREKAQEEEQATIADLREVASDLGVDPDDEDLDYGQPGQSWRERLALVRQTAKELAKPAKPTQPKPRQNTGDAVNDNGGTPPAPKPKAPQYTKADLDKELAAYTDTHKREHLVKAEEIRNALVAQAESRLASR